MKILHYFLGFPPFRTGGLTKYAFDLMKTQACDGHTVIALWPGRIGGINHKTSIKKKSDKSGIQNYELINPLPVPLDEGISEFSAYMNPCDSAIYDHFLKSIMPDVIHIHTLMGLHKEFVEVAARLHIITVFTTHDYFGICPKVTLCSHGEACEDDHNCKSCIQCNYSALSIKKIMIMQSPAYRILKNFPVVKLLRKQHRREFFMKETLPEMHMLDVEIPALAQYYQKLRAYYVEMLEMMDCIHFNSSVTEFVYKKYLKPKSSVVMTITHQNIADNRTVNQWNPGEKLRITSLAPAKPFKGFNVLRTALDELWASGKQNFELKIYSPVQNPSPYMKVHEDGFQYDQLKRIMADTDVLVAPSIWYETFGFTVLEAISYGVPVIVSTHVGAKDVIGDGGIVLEAGSAQKIKEAILSLTNEKQLQMRKNIKESVRVKTWKEFMDENYRLYYDLEDRNDIS